MIIEATKKLVERENLTAKEAQHRKGTGLRTIFNILGPLTNPAHATVELMGVYSEELVEPLAQVLCNLGVKRGMVVYGQDQLDEISLSAPTTYVEIDNGTLKKYEITPEQFGLKRCRKEELTGGDGAQNARIAEHILKNEDTGAKREAVLLNAGAAIYLMDGAKSVQEGVEKARETLESGKAYETLQNFVRLTNAS